MQANRYTAISLNDQVVVYMTPPPGKKLPAYEPYFPDHREEGGAGGDVAGDALAGAADGIDGGDELGVGKPGGEIVGVAGEVGVEERGAGMLGDGIAEEGDEVHEELVNGVAKFAGLLLLVLLLDFLQDVGGSTHDATGAFAGAAGAEGEAGALQVGVEKLFDAGLDVGLDVGKQRGNLEVGIRTGKEKLSQVQHARATALGGGVLGEVAGATDVPGGGVGGEKCLAVRDAGGLDRGGDLLETGGGDVDVAAAGDEGLEHVLRVRRRRAEDDDRALRGLLHRLEQRVSRGGGETVRVLDDDYPKRADRGRTRRAADDRTHVLDANGQLRRVHNREIRVAPVQCLPAAFAPTAGGSVASSGTVGIVAGSGTADYVRGAEERRGEVARHRRPTRAGRAGNEPGVRHGGARLASAGGVGCV